MRVERFSKADELLTLNAYLDKWQEPPVELAELPIFGFTALGEGRPVAFAFLRRCEGGIGIFDSLVTDKDAPSEIRHEAIEMLTAKILTTAKALGMTRVIAFTRHPAILERAKSHAFERQAHVVISRQL